jgi:hypothetical protein
MPEPQPTDNPIVKEEHKGRLRIRLYRQATAFGLRFAVEVAAWNEWAGQGKIIDLLGGLTHDQARSTFAAAVATYADYDWMTGECVLEEQVR